MSVTLTQHSHFSKESRPLGNLKPSLWGTHPHSHTESYLGIYCFERCTETSLTLPQRPVSGSTPWITEIVFSLLCPLAKGTVNFSCSRSSWGHPSFWSLSSSLPTTLNQILPWTLCRDNGQGLIYYSDYSEIIFQLLGCVWILVWVPNLEFYLLVSKAADPGKKRKNSHVAIFSHILIKLGKRFGGKLWK